MQEAEDIDNLVADVVFKRFEANVRQRLNDFANMCQRGASKPIESNESIVEYTRTAIDFVRFELRQIDRELGVSTAERYHDVLTEYLQLKTATIDSLVKVYLSDFKKQYNGESR